MTGPVSEVVWHPSSVERSARWRALGSVGATVWLTGLSGSGKSTVAVEIEQQLIERGQPAYILDGDNLRHGLNADLGFAEADRDENVRRVAHVARLFADAGLVAIVPLISPYRRARALARDLHVAAGLDFFEVFVDTPLDVCEQRDPKGLYARARRGEVAGMTGIDAPYEPPTSPELRLPGEQISPDEAARRIIELLPMLPLRPGEPPSR